MAGTIQKQDLNYLVSQINKVVGISIQFGEGGAKIKPPVMPDDLFLHYEVQYLMCEEIDQSCENTTTPETLSWDRADTILFDQLDGKLTISGLIPGRVYWFRARAWSVDGGVGEKWYYENFAAATLSVAAPTSIAVTPVTGDPKNSNYGSVIFGCNYTYSNLVSRIEIWDRDHNAVDAKLIGNISIEEFQSSGSANITVVIPEFNNQMTTVEYYFYAVDINTGYSSAAHGVSTQLSAADVNIGTYYPDSADTKIVSDKDNFIVKFDVLDISDIFYYSKYRYKNKVITDITYGTYTNWFAGTDIILLPNHNSQGQYMQYVIQYQIFDNYGNVYNLDNDQNTEMLIAGTDLTPPKMVSPLKVYAPYFNENFDSYNDGDTVAAIPGDWSESDIIIPQITWSYKSGETLIKDGGKCVAMQSTPTDESWIQYNFSTTTFVNFAYLYRLRFKVLGYPLYSFFHLNSSEGVKLIINQGGTVVLTRENGGTQLLSYSHSAFSINIWYNVLIMTMGYNKTAGHDVGAITTIIDDTEIIPTLNTEYHGICSGQGTTTEIYLDTSATSLNDDYYNDMYVRIIGGSGLGGEAVVADYIGSTHKCILDRALPEIPDGTTEYYIMQLPYVNIPSDGNGYIKFTNPVGGDDVYVDNIEVYKNNYVSN